VSDINPFEPDPAVRMPGLAQMRAKCPITALSPQGPYLALGHEVVASGFKRVDEFGGSAGQKGLPEEDKTIAGILEPRHSQVRRIINSVVAFHKSQQIEGFLGELCASLVNEMAIAASGAGDEGLDVMPLFADPIPPRAIARLIGFPPEDSDRYYHWADELGARFAVAAANGTPLSMIDATPDFASYVLDHIDRRRSLPPDEWPNDALSRFLSTDVDGEKLSARSVCVQIMFLIGAGSETTRNLLGNILYRLALDQNLYQRIRADPSLVDALVEEGLRYDAPAQFMVRHCLRGATLGEEQIPEGGRVMLGIGAANHDPAAFPAPETFDIDRPNRDHLAFGYGSHICPGASLARLEARSAMTAFVAKFQRFRLADDYQFDHADTAMLHGPKTLRLVLVAD
jgi:cytochrome P450